MFMMFSSECVNEHKGEAILTYKHPPPPSPYFVIYHLFLLCHKSTYFGKTSIKHKNEQSASRVFICSVHTPNLNTVGEVQTQRGSCWSTTEDHETTQSTFSSSWCWKYNTILPLYWLMSCLMVREVRLRTCSSFLFLDYTVLNRSVKKYIPGIRSIHFPWTYGNTQNEKFFKIFYIVARVL